MTTLTAADLALEQVEAYYWAGHRHVAPLEVARASVAYRKAFRVRAGDLSRRIQVTAGVIHHYESLLRLDSSLRNCVTGIPGSASPPGTIPFKTARALADLPNARQVELGALCLTGAVRSKVVEGAVVVMRHRPNLSAAAAVAVVEGVEPAPSSTAPAEVVPPEDLRADLLRVAGRVSLLLESPVPEYERLGIMRGLTTLRDHVDGALNGLSNGNARHVGSKVERSGR